MGEETTAMIVASSWLMFLLSITEDSATLPEGAPHRIPNIVGYTPFSETPNSVEIGSFKKSEILLAVPELISIPFTTKIGKSEGITVFKQR